MSVLKPSFDEMKTLIDKFQEEELGRLGEIPEKDTIRKATLRTEIILFAGGTRTLYDLWKKMDQEEQNQFVCILYNMRAFFLMRNLAVECGQLYDPKSHYNVRAMVNKIWNKP